MITQFLTEPTIMSRKVFNALFIIIISSMLYGCFVLISALITNFNPLITSIIGAFIALSGIFCITLFFYPEKYYEVINRNQTQQPIRSDDNEDKKFGFSDIPGAQIHWSEVVSDPDYAVTVEEILDNELYYKTPKHHYYYMYDRIRQDPFVYEIFINEIALMNGEKYILLKKAFFYKTPLLIKIGNIMALILSLKYGFDDLSVRY